MFWLRNKLIIFFVKVKKDMVNPTHRIQATPKTAEANVVEALIIRAEFGTHVSRVDILINNI